MYDVHSSKVFCFMETPFLMGHVTCMMSCDIVYDVMWLYTLTSLSLSNN